MTLDEIAKVMSDNIRLRDKLLSIAKECAECGGTGCRTVQVEIEGEPLYERVEDCAVCLDIREALL